MAKTKRHSACPTCGVPLKPGAVCSTCNELQGLVGGLAVFDYPRLLLNEARRLVGTSLAGNGIAVVVAHMACEVAVQNAMLKALREHHLPELEEPLLDIMNGFNLANERLRKVYTGITGDHVEHQLTFWNNFVTSAKRRNKVVHDGLTVPTKEANDSVSAAELLILHLQSL